MQPGTLIPEEATILLRASVFKELSSAKAATLEGEVFSSITITTEKSKRYLKLKHLPVLNKFNRLTFHVQVAMYSKWLNDRYLYTSDRLPTSATFAIIGIY